MAEHAPNALGEAPVDDAWYLENRAAIAEQTRQRRARASSRVAMHRGRAARAGVVNTLTTEEWLAILRLARGVCHYCERQVGSAQLTLDHVVPISRGGANTAENVVPACFPCNARKSRHLVDEIPVVTVQVVDDLALRLQRGSQAILLLRSQVAALIDELQSYCL
ncbi:MAG: HNH endonuclease [Herpetosiphonaceae bacterium]|nr:HNH endonuclease [Herpetosiphonaceae bacterium]